MDFFQIKERVARNGSIEVYPDFKILRSKDLMVRGRAFYAIWDEKKGLWSSDEYDVQRLVDEEIYAYVQERYPDLTVGLTVKYLSDFSSQSWLQFRNYIGHLSDSSHQLDDRLTFSNTEVRKDDYISRRLPYPLASGSHIAWDELVGTLYEPSEQAKLEWAIGAIVSGDARHIQKFLVLYGAAGSGKSTILNVIQRLFEGYYTTFEAKALTGSANAFSTEVFKSNPLVAIQHDGDLSKIEDNTKLNSIVSHEEMTLNEKYKPAYMARINAFLFMGTNRPVKISDAKSGIIRRLIDVRPSGNRIPPQHYQALLTQIDFELGAIAHHCLRVYLSMGKNYYASYRPVEMMLQTDVFFNFIEAHYELFRKQDGTTLAQAYELYKVFCDETLVEFKLPRHRFREELKNYFGGFLDRAEIEGSRVRSWYFGFKADHFKEPVEDDEHEFALVVDEDTSLLDHILADAPAQYASSADKPSMRWSQVRTKLSELDTTRTHYVKVPQNHIVIDFDLTDEEGRKSLERNLAAASEWPPTYAEISKGGSGVHLHYTWDGDSSTLARAYAPGIEIKTFPGDASLRRKVTRCNSVAMATISSGLPTREKRLLNADSVKSEKGLRDLIARNLRKEIHPGTKPSIDFINHILDEAYESGMHYDVTDLRPKIMAFANNSTNQALYCLKVVASMKFASEETAPQGESTDEQLAFFDIEVYPNLFVVCWKYEGDSNIVAMVNPTPAEVEEVIRLKLVGYNCRRYDNHILYAAFLGYNNEELYKLSQKIIHKSRTAMFGEAYDISYADIYDYLSKKQTLKRWEIDLGIKHVESELPWDEPVPEDKIEQVIAYCKNDVVAEEAVFHARKQDFVARQILAEVSGLPVNASTQQHTARIIFGTDKAPQEKFVYTDLSEMFPGYTYDMGKSSYRGENPGEGGYVYAEPGMYENVALLDVESMHPTSIEELNLFGPYTQNFAALKAARMAIKHGEFESARGMLGGKLAKHLQNEEQAKELSYALKIVINIVYGLTSAKFDNKFRDLRNRDNIVAKRGALFMIDLKHAVQERGFQVIHIKTDSVKIPNATPEIIEFVKNFGSRYGYTFEHEATYDKLCLVNDAVYIAKKNGTWSATGAQFAHPYVFKKLFSHEEIRFEDLCETKSVTTALYLDFDGVDKPMFDDKGPHFVGRVGTFVPVEPGSGGGLLVRKKDDKFYAATGTKGYFWLEAEVVRSLGMEDAIDMSYYDKLVDDAITTISKFGDFTRFLD